MYSGQQVFPTVTPGFGSTAPSTMSGITVDQLAVLVAMHALMSNPNYTPNTFQEMAQKAKEISAAVLVVM